MSGNDRRMWRLLAKIGVYSSLGLLLSGCVGPSPSERERASGSSQASSRASDDARVWLLPVDDLRENLLMRQHVTVKWADREESFDAVLQKRGDVLLLLGLGPMNTVGFKLTLDRDGVSFENFSGRELPFRPERILADVQRVFYPWIQEGWDCVECERREILDGLEVWERIGARFLVERSFRLLARPERGRIVVRYEGWTSDPPVPIRATLDNGWYGYELTIVTTGIERID